MHDIYSLISLIYVSVIPNYLKMQYYSASYYFNTSYFTTCQFYGEERSIDAAAYFKSLATFESHLPDCRCNKKKR